MPTNKHASFRYRVLDQCFGERGRRKWSLQELVSEVSRYLQEEFGAENAVSLRTIQGDISVMRSHPPRGYSAPIVCSNGRYYYADPEYRISNIPFRKEELEILRASMGLIRQIPGISHLPIIDVVQQRFEYEQDDEHKRKELIQLEVIHRVKGTEWIPLIYQSMIQKVVLQIVYQPFSDDEMSFYLHPYLLKEWRNRWYVFGREGREKNEKTSGNTARQWLIERMGFIPRSDHIWNVPLDRIISIHNCPDIPFLENDLFDPDTWFDEIAGVTKPENTAPIQIEMEADTIAYYYIESKPFHASQSLLFRDEEKAVFSLKLIPNYEIITDILAYGKYVRVRSPESFKKMLSDIKS